MAPVLTLLIQVFVATFSARGTLHKGKKVSKRPSITILMPAHNEALVIGPSIKAVRKQLLAQDQLLVIADNCSDETAAIAKSEGATVIERSNQNERGKGYALDFGIQHIQSDPTEVVMIVDADCLVSEGAITELATACMQQQRPVQALYLMEVQPEPSLKARIAAFAWLVKNKVRPLGFKLLGLPCQLMGTGMAFLWADISQANLATGHIVEDMKLGVELARLKKAPIFLLEAVVTSVFPPSEAAEKTQRSRWEHGHLSMIINEVPKLMMEALKTGNVQMFTLALDLFVPPLAMLTLMVVMVFIISLLFGNTLTMLGASGLLLTILVTVLLAWLKFGQAIISFKQLCYAPIYALMKVPLYLKFFVNRQVEWVRSKRD